MSDNKDSKVIDMNSYFDTVTGGPNSIDNEFIYHDYDEKSYDFSNDGEPGSTEGKGLWSEEISAYADMQTIESLFFSEDWVFIIVDLIAQKISSQPLLVMKYIRNHGASDSVDFADNHPLNKLIENPNEYQDYHSWMYNYVTQYTLLGNSINWYSERLKQIISLRTSQMQIDFTNDGKINNYLQFQTDETQFQFAKRKGMIFPKKEIIHTRRPNPISLIWGLSPFVPGRKSILFNRYSSDYLNSFYLKQATPGMIIEMDRQVNEQQVIRQLRSFELAYTGRKNQRRTMILPKGVKATPSSHSIADQRLSELIESNRETIIALLKVPKHELGLQTSGSLGSDDYRVAIRNFWEATLKPTMRMIEGSLTKFFAKQLGENYFLQFDLSDVDALQEDLLTKADTAAKMLAAGYTVNEVREKIWELKRDISLDADKPYILIKQQPQNSFGSFGSQPPASEKPPIVVDDQDEETEELENKAIDSSELKLKAIINGRKSGWLESVTKSLEDIAEGKDGRELEIIALETLVTLAEVALPIVKANLVETKADIPSKTKLRKRIQDAFDNFEESWVTEFVKTLNSSVDLGYDQQLELIFNEVDREKIEALKAKTSRHRRSILEARGFKSFTEISKTHTDRIMREIIIGSEQGESIQEITNRVKNTFADPEKMAAKASTIARTETLTAVSIGQAGLLENAKEVIPGLKKAWINSNDSRVRDSHLDKSQGGVSGEIVDADEEFSNGLRWPRDLKSENASDVINCRCTLITLPPGEDI